MTALTANLTATIVFGIVEGRRSYIDTLIYSGIDSVSSELRRNILGYPLMKQGDPYESDVDPRDWRRRHIYAGGDQHVADVGHSHDADR